MSIEAFKKQMADLEEYRAVEVTAGAFVAGFKRATRKLPTLSDGKPRYVTHARYAELVAAAKWAGKPLREWLELGGARGKGKL